MRVNAAAIVVMVTVGAAAVAILGRSPSPAPAPVAEPAAPSAPALPPVTQTSGTLPPGHPPLGNNNLPPGHPPVSGSGNMGGMGAMPRPEPSILWTAPPRWIAVPHMSTMRIATYQVPKAQGDIEDAELSVTRAGGDIEANATRWIAQFDEASRAGAKRSKKKVGSLDVHIVEVTGDYAGMSAEVEKDWALLGAIVGTPGGSHFFKLTGPKKSVLAARAEFDALIDSVKPKS